MTLITKVTVVMITMITNIRRTLIITEKITTTTIMVTTQSLNLLSRQKQ